MYDILIINAVRKMLFHTNLSYAKISFITSVSTSTISRWRIKIPTKQIGRKCKP